MATFLDLLHDISVNLKAEDVKSLKFLSSGKIGKKKMETIESGIDLFTILKELNEISADNTAFLHYLLNKSNRVDLVEKVKHFDEGEYSDPVDQPDRKERERLEVAYDVICDNVGRNWKMFVRKLKVPEAKIDAIMTANPYDLREQLMQSLKYWQKSKGKEANVEDLLFALRNCNMKLVEDVLMEQISKTQA